MCSRAFRSPCQRHASVTAHTNVVVASAVMLLAPLVSSIGQVTVKRWGSGVHPVALNAGSMVVCAVVMALLAAILERGQPVRFDGTSVAALLYLAVLGTCVTFTLYFWLLRHMPATHLALTAYAIPVIAVIVGALAFGEPVTLRLLVGAALVVGGTALTTRRRGA